MLRLFFSSKSDNLLSLRKELDERKRQRLLIVLVTLTSNVYATYTTWKALMQEKVGTHNIVTKPFL